MKYRIRIDAWIDKDADLPAIKTALKNLSNKLTNVGAEKAKISYHKCHHDTGGSCEEEKILWEKE